MAREVAEGEEFVDEWGNTWRREGYYNMVVNHPLKGKDADYIRDYQLPDPHAPKRFEKLEELIRDYGETHFIGADVSGVLFEPAYHLRDMEDLMIDMAMESEEADILLDKLAEFCIAVSIESIKRGADWIWMGDDLGSQKAMLMSPDMWRTYFKPRMKYIIDSIRAYKKDIYIGYHSCGSMFPVIEDLIEVGIDVLNPLQDSAVGMDHDVIKKEFGHRATMMCGIDIQQFMNRATPDEVRAKTRDIVERLSPNGGFIFAASHCIQPDVPVENIYAMFETLDELQK
jgi:uroporphyrinogen decarboxylase